MGPVIEEENLEELKTKLDALQDGDILILAGSIPASIPDMIYRDIMKRLQKRSTVCKSKLKIGNGYNIIQRRIKRHNRKNRVRDKLLQIIKINQIKLILCILHQKYLE